MLRNADFQVLDFDIEEAWVTHPLDSRWRASLHLYVVSAGVSGDHVFTQGVFLSATQQTPLRVEGLHQGITSHSAQTFICTRIMGNI